MTRRWRELPADAIICYWTSRPRRVRQAISVVKRGSAHGATIRERSDEQGHIDVGDRCALPRNPNGRARYEA